MKKTIYLIMICICFFICNILLYNFNKDYKVFVKNLKYNNENQIITDDQVTPTKDISSIVLIDKMPQSTKEMVDNLINDNKWGNTEAQKTWTSSVNTVENNIQNSLIQKNIDEILNIFTSYNLIKNTQDYSLFWLKFDLETAPAFKFDKYNSSNFEMYLFKNWTFDEIQIAYDLNKDNSTPKFTINQTNSFWKKSFFINTIQDDWKAKLMIESKNLVIWFNIDKNYYNDLKNILVKL